MAVYIVSAEEMRRLDRYTIEQIGIPAAVLMENAGRAVAEEVAALGQKLGLVRESGPVHKLEHESAHESAHESGHRRIFESAGKPWLVLVGKGNNGADGVVAARHLRGMGIAAELLYAADPAGLSGEAALQRDIAGRLGIPSNVYTPGSVTWDRYAGIVDALLGTGTSGAPRAPYSDLIREASASGLPIVAVDIPSGLDADTGQVHDPCVRADVTVTFAFRKRGLTQYPGAEAAGTVVVRSIGIPEELANRGADDADAEASENSGQPAGTSANALTLSPVQVFWADRDMFRRRFGITLPFVRKPDAHKGTYGHVLVAGGTMQYSGAGLLAAKAALRAGAGLVSWALPEKLAGAMAGRVPEVMLISMTDGGRGDWSSVPAEDVIRLARGKHALVIGPGMGRCAADAAWLRQIWSGAECPIVVDADALNMIAEAGGMAKMPPRQTPAILTPHPGEMARLTGLSTQEVQRDRIGLARSFAVQHGVTLVLKGARTVTAAPTGDAFVNASGNAGMATAGAGDTLAGIIGALLAQGHDAGLAAALGVYLHGAAGDRAAACRPSPGSLIAGDIIDHLM